MSGSKGDRTTPLPYACNAYAFKSEGFISLFVGFFWVVHLFSDEFKLLIGVFLKCPVEAGLVADVALSGVHGDFQNQTILVAINEDLFDFLEVTALLTFLP